VLAALDIPGLLTANKFFIHLVSLVCSHCLCFKCGTVGNDS